MTLEADVDESRSSLRPRRDNVQCLRLIEVVGLGRKCLFDLDQSARWPGFFCCYFVESLSRISIRSLALMTRQDIVECCTTLRCSGTSRDLPFESQPERIDDDGGPRRNLVDRSQRRCCEWSRSLLEKPALEFKHSAAAGSDSDKDSASRRAKTLQYCKRCLPCRCSWPDGTQHPNRLDGCRSSRLRRSAVPHALHIHFSQTA